MGSPGLRMGRSAFLQRGVFVCKDVTVTFSDPRAMFPGWAQRLVFLFWRLRTCRGMSRPSSRTWHRRIAAEKRRLVADGVDRFQLHAVCVLLRRGEHSPAARRAFRLLHGAPSAPGLETGESALLETVGLESQQRRGFPSPLSF